MADKTEITRRAALAAAGVAGLTAIAANADVAVAQEPKSKKDAAKDPLRNWRTSGPYATLDEVAEFVNRDPDQGPGEVSVTTKDGQFWVLWYL